ncbi:hypothetical protein BC940DRAFT_342634 [Gongronella butleri]|nr:hypothetical protein BC940DRAFT_342634 [Gongronella butleri]
MRATQVPMSCSKPLTTLTEAQLLDVQDLIEFVSRQPRQKRIRNRRRRSPSGEPPRPMNCFLIYRREKQEQITALCKGANHRDISKIIGRWWKVLPAAHRCLYEEKAKNEKALHAKRYPNYRYAPRRKPASFNPKSRDGSSSMATDEDETETPSVDETREMSLVEEVLGHDAIDAAIARDVPLNPQLESNVLPPIHPRIIGPQLPIQLETTDLLPIRHAHAHYLDKTPAVPRLLSPLPTLAAMDVPAAVDSTCDDMEIKMESVDKDIGRVLPQGGVDGADDMDVDAPSPFLDERATRSCRILDHRPALGNDSPAISTISTISTMALPMHQQLTPQATPLQEMTPLPTPTQQPAPLIAPMRQDDDLPWPGSPIPSPFIHTSPSSPVNPPLDSPVNLTYMPSPAASPSGDSGYGSVAPSPNSLFMEFQEPLEMQATPRFSPLVQPEHVSHLSNHDDNDDNDGEDGEDGEDDDEDDADDDEQSPRMVPKMITIDLSNASRRNAEPIFEGKPESPRLIAPFSANASPYVTPCKTFKPLAPSPLQKGATIAAARKVQATTLATPSPLQQLAENAVSAELPAHDDAYQDSPASIRVAFDDASAQNSPETQPDFVNMPWTATTMPLFPNDGHNNNSNNKQQPYGDLVPRLANDIDVVRPCFGFAPAHLPLKHANSPVSPDYAYQLALHAAYLNMQMPAADTVSASALAASVTARAVERAKQNWSRMDPLAAIQPAYNLHQTLDALATVDPVQQHPSPWMDPMARPHACYCGGIPMVNPDLPFFNPPPTTEDGNLPASPPQLLPWWASPPFSPAVANPATARNIPNNDVSKH